MNFKFDGSISREVLNNYISRAVSHIGFCSEYVTPNMQCTDSQTFEDDLRMLVHEGAKLIGRAASVWGKADEEVHLETVRRRCERVHEVDPDIVLQGCVFESIYPGYIKSVKVPAWVFDAFELPFEDRYFNYEAMLYPSGKYVNHWSPDDGEGLAGSIEDINQLETQMWIFYKACSYINAGCEGIHFGQVHLIGSEDDGLRCWEKVIGMIRGYAKVHARRHYVLCDAHTHGITVNTRSLFDYNCYPLRLKENFDKPYECYLEEGHLDSLFGRSCGGFSPSGWYAENLPFIVEFDNYGMSDHIGIPKNNFYPWGYDEITWYAYLKCEQRHAFLRYAENWINSRYPEGWLQMPSRRCINNYNCPSLSPGTEIVKTTVTANNPELLESILTHELPYEKPVHISGNNYEIIRGYYNANTPSDSIPFGYGDEDVIAELFKARKCPIQED